MSHPEDLARRDGLPEPLRVLLASFPRDGWETNPNFAGLLQFWLDRHLMFRRLTEALETDAQAAIDRTLDPEHHKARVARYGGALVQNLHGHHQIEDAHYFPVLARLEAPLARGFDILDRDHHDLDALLQRFTNRANALLQGTSGAGDFLKDVEAFRPFLHRHLTDEEELVVPVILKHGPDGLH